MILKSYLRLYYYCTTIQNIRHDTLDELQTGFKKSLTALTQTQSPNTGRTHSRPPITNPSRQRIDPSNSLFPLQRASECGSPAMNGAEDCGARLDRSMGPEMDLVNRPNPWLPAYGFQIQHHHANFQPTHEDLRANGSLTRRSSLLRPLPQSPGALRLSEKVIRASPEEHALADPRRCAHVTAPRVARLTGRPALARRPVSLAEKRAAVSHAPLKNAAALPPRRAEIRAGSVYTAAGGEGGGRIAYALCGASGARAASGARRRNSSACLFARARAAFFSLNKAGMIYQRGAINSAGAR